MKTAGIAILGTVLVLAGVALLVLPGPGFVLIAAGLVILSTRFESAKKPLEYAKVRARHGMNEMARSKPRAAFAILCALALVVIGILEVIGLDLPFVTTMTAVLLIISGLFLVGTVVYAIKRGSAVSSEVRR